MFGIILSIAAALLLLAFSLLSISRKRTIAGSILSLSVFLLAVIEILNQLSLNLASDYFIYKKIALFLESFLPVTLLISSISYARQKPFKTVSIIWGFIIASAMCFPAGIFFFDIDSFFYSPDFQTEKILFLGDVGYWFYLGIMLYCILALMNFEATFSSTSGIDRWRIKFEALGIMSILSVLIFYYSQGLLYRTINMNLLPIRSGVFIVASLLAVYSKIFREKESRVVVSRYILYRSLSLLVVGVYLITLGLIGQGMKYFDVSFSKHLTVFLAFVGGILVLLVLLSDTLRRHIRVFISKHFYKSKHDYREEWLKFTDRLATCRTFADVQEATLTTFREIFGLKVASLYLLDSKKERYLPVSPHPESGNSLALEKSAGLISYFRERGRVFDTSNYDYVVTEDEDSFVKANKAVLIVPLIFNKNVEGFVVLGWQLASERFNYEDYDLMKVLARQAALSIINFRLSEELAEAREVAALGRISSFIIHDLKNLTYALSLTLDNAEDYIGDPEFQKDMVDSVRITLSKMKNLIQKLKSIPEKHALNTKLTDIQLLTQKTAREIGKPGQDVNIVHNESRAFSMIDEEEIRKVIINLIINAFDAIDGNGAVKIETGIDGDAGYIRVSDNGPGMTEDFINEHLFKPFRTTKDKGLGIGLYQCKQIIEAHGGKILAESRPGVMTAFTVYLPLADASDITF
ncbi:MAG: XrtA/PEP-CTERM system histidine kinase PrsK [Nitrospirota bacterium]